MANFKAQAHARELKQRLSLSVASASFSEKLDANGNPELTMVKSGETIVIKIETLDNAGRVDGLGLPQRAYSPHKVQIVQIDIAVNAEARAKALVACAKLGMKLELFEKAAITGDYATDIAGATKVAEIASDEINALTTSQ